MELKNTEYEIHDGIATIWLSRAHRMNAWTGRLHTEYRHLLAQADADRQVKAIANNVIEQAKKAKHKPLGVEGMNTGDWVLVDLNDIVVHVMLPQVRDFYNIESMWEVDDHMPKQ